MQCYTHLLSLSSYPCHGLFHSPPGLMNTLGRQKQRGAVQVVPSPRSTAMWRSLWALWHPVAPTTFQDNMIPMDLGCLDLHTERAH